MYKCQPAAVTIVRPPPGIGGIELGPRCVYSQAAVFNWPRAASTAPAAYHTRSRRLVHHLQYWFSNRIQSTSKYTKALQIMQHSNRSQNI